MTDRARLVWQHVEGRHGEDAAVSRPALVEATGLSDRQVRRAIELLRKEYGKAIVASPTGGYFLPVTDEELAAYVRPQKAKALSELQNLAAVSRAAAADVVHELDLDGHDADGGTRRAEGSEMRARIATCGFERCSEKFEPREYPKQIYCSEECRRKQDQRDRERGRELRGAGDLFDDLDDQRRAS